MDEDFSFPDEPSDFLGAESPPSAPAVSQSDATFAYEWQKVRRRNGRDPFFNLPVGKFGPADGSIVLWVPSPVEASGYVFENGEPVLRQTPSCLNDPQIQSVRDEAFLSFQSTGVPGVFDIGAAFLKYVAAVLRLNYDLSDADLTFLISGKGWQSGMVRHLLGGDDVVERLLKLGNLADGAAGVGPSPQPSPIPSLRPDACSNPVPKRSGWLRRWFGR